jgi:plastocyanin
MTKGDPMKTLTLLLAVAAVALAGCGSSDKEKAASTSTPTATATATANTGGASAGGGQVVKLSADPSALKFDPSKLTAKAGTVTLQMANPSGLPHAVSVEGKGIDKDGKTVQKGGTSTVTAKLKPGTYEFYCPVDGHRAAGMEGKLTVQ